MQSGIFVLACVHLLLTGKQPRNVLLVSIAAASATTQATNLDPGPPKENHAESTLLPRNHGHAKFHCSFSGNPLPHLEWKFSNASKLPNTSQFQIGPQQQLSQFQAGLDLTVFGTRCRDISLLQFQCFARNVHSFVKSKVFMFELGNLLPLEEHSTCSKVINDCQSKGGRLPVVFNQNMLDTISSLLDAPFWISGDSGSYFPKWSPNVVQAAGCIHMLVGGIEAAQSNDTWIARAACEVSQPPQANVTQHVDECDGSNVNISWNIQPGAESLSHKVFIGPNETFTVPARQSSVILTNLQPMSLYDVKILPLFEGCSGVPLTKNHTINTGCGLPNSTTNVAIKKVGNTCNIRWSIEGKQDDFEKIFLRYYEVQNLRIYFLSAAPNKIATISLDKFSRQYTIVRLAPNTIYQILVGTVPLSPCREKVPVVWSKLFEGSCITDTTIATDIMVHICSCLVIPIFSFVIVLLIIFYCIKRKQYFASSTNIESAIEQIELQPVYVNTDQTRHEYENLNPPLPSSVYENVDEDIKYHVYESVDMPGMVRAASEDSVLSPIS